MVMRLVYIISPQNMVCNEDLLYEMEKYKSYLDIENENIVKATKQGKCVHTRRTEMDQN